MLQERVLIIGTDPHYLVRFRRELIELLSCEGAEVFTASWPDNGFDEQALSRLGVTRHFELPIRQGSMNPLEDFKLLWFTFDLMRKLRPSVVISYTAKPVIWGSIAAAFAGVPKRISLVEGLGFAFTHGPGLTRLIAKLALSMGYFVALRCATRIITLNQEDQRALARLAKLNPRAISILAGIGVSEAYFDVGGLPSGITRFLYVGRMLRDKGVVELLEAGRILRTRGTPFELRLVGAADRNPAQLSKTKFNELIDAAEANYVGYSDAIPAELAAAHVLVLPSYREGFPRVIMEAMAAGRPSIATEVPGCRDAIIDGTDGLLVPPRDPVALANAMEALANDRALVARMADAARSHAETHFRATDRAREMIVIALGAVG